MANSIPAVANRRRTGFNRRARDVLRAVDLDGVPGLYNAALAECGTGTVISQEWRDGQCSHSGSIPVDGEMVEIPIATWIVPAVSDRHDTLELEVRGYAEAGAVEGRVIFRSVVEGDEVEVAVPVGAINAESWTAVGSLGIASVATDSGLPGGSVAVEIIEMYLETDDPGGSVIIEQVHGEIDSLSSPLPAALISGAPPLGTGRMGADLPLPAARGSQLIACDTVLRSRPRSALAWSGLNPEYDGAVGADAVPPPHGVLGAMRHLLDEDLEVQAGRQGLLQPRTIRPPAPRFWGISPPGVQGEGIITTGIVSVPGGLGDTWEVIPGNGLRVFDNGEPFTLSVWGAAP